MGCANRAARPKSQRVGTYIAEVPEMLYKILDEIVVEIRAHNFVVSLGEREHVSHAVVV